MDIYEEVNSILELNKSTGDENADEERINTNLSLYFAKFKKINFNEPLFKGPSITDICNPVSCRLIIFFTDTLIPYFIKNIIPKNTISEDTISEDTIPKYVEQHINVINNFTAIFNFIFYLIFDKYGYNEKKWIVQQINSILKGLKNVSKDYLKEQICISFEKHPRVKGLCNLTMKISKEANYKLENSPYYDDDVLLEELKKVLNRCLTFWKILPQEQETEAESSSSIATAEQIIDTYKNSTAN